MSEESLVKIFESPRGINQVDSPKSEAFQPGGEQAPFLAKAENVDLLRTGSYKRRQGRTLLRTLTSGHSLWSGGHMMLYADAGDLKHYQNGGDTTLVSGLHTTAEISFTEAGGYVFWSNGYERGMLKNGVNHAWGATPINAPSLSVTTGSLLAGSYLVAVTPIIDGVEGGCVETAEITLAETGGVQVSVPHGYDGYYVYLSDTNGNLPFYHSTQTETSFALTSRTSSVDPCNTLGTFPPPPGHLVRYWNGRILVATSGAYYGDALYFSDPLAYHHFRPEENMQMFPSRIVMVEPVPDGFYVGIEGGGVFFVQGDDPRKLKRTQVDDKPVCEGSAIRVPSNKLPWLQTDLSVPVLVPIWATPDGWAVGLPGGTVRYPVEGRLAVGTNLRATAAFVERPSLRQILLSAREKSMTSRIGTGDQMSLSVTRGGVPL